MSKKNGYTARINGREVTTTLVSEAASWAAAGFEILSCPPGAPSTIRARVKPAPKKTPTNPADKPAKK